MTATTDSREGARSDRGKWLAVIVVGTIAAILLGANGPLGGFWGVETYDVEPAGAALAGLVTAGIVESIAFGVGLAWIAFGWPLVKPWGRLGFATYGAIAWGLVSWPPHSSFHQSTRIENWAGLAGIEWGFHVTLVISAFIVAAFVWRVLRTADPSASALPA